ncbi:hypothetical protein QUA71_09555 [Microcoleus sp. MON1_C5]|uniref:hypothetical protein n=1 Tax=Microcoleus sp. MON1_C5 TaxID=2818828 RepID=UPI002FD6EEDB
MNRVNHLAVTSSSHKMREWRSRASANHGAKNRVKLRSKRHTLLNIQQPMQKASEMRVENLDYLGLVASLIDRLGIYPKIGSPA